MEMPRAQVGSSPLEPAYFYCLLLSLAAGLFFLFVVQLPVKWFLFLFGTALFFAASIAAVDRKRFYLVLLVFALPFGLSKTLLFVRSPIFRSTFGYTVYASFGPLFVLYFIWLYRRIFRDESLPVSTRGLLPFAGLFAMALISCFLVRTRWPLCDLFELACSGILFIYTASELRRTSDLRLVAVLLIVVGTFEGLLGIAQYLTGSALGFGFVGRSEFLTGYVGLLQISRVMGTVGHPNSLAMIFDFLLPLTFAFLLFYPMQTWKRILALPALFFEYLGLSVTFSRGGIVCSSLAMSLLLFIYLKRKMGAFRGLAIFLFIAMSFVIVVLVTPNPIQKALFRAEAGETAAGRIPLDKVALEVIRARPLTGLGLNSYVENVGRYDNTPEQLNLSWNTPVHNLFLFIAGEIGLLGLFFFLWLLWVVLRPLPKIFAVGDPLLECCAMGVFMGTMAFLGHNMVDLAAWTHPRFVWFILGTGVAIRRLALDYEPIVQPAWNSNGELTASEYPPVRLDQEIHPGRSDS